MCNIHLYRVLCFSWLLIAPWLSAGEPATNLRLAPLEASASHGSLAFSSAMQAGQTPSPISLPAGEVWVGRLHLPAMPEGGLFTFTMRTNSGYTVQAELSTDSTDGIDGAWLEMEVPLWMPNENERVRLQKVEISPSLESRWLRVSLTNSSPTLGAEVSDLELHAYDPGGANDYWLAVGASIISQGVSHEDFKAGIREFFGPERDPIMFNLGVSGATTNSWVAGSPSRLDQVLALHPQARYVVVHLGGNNVTADRPYSDGSSGAQTMGQQLELIYTSIINAGMSPIPMRLSYRDYKSEPVVGGGEFPENGSLPYNMNIIDPLIARVAPDAFDFSTNLPRVDPYTFLLENPNYLSADGVHLGTGGRLAWSRDILARQAGAIVYSLESEPLGFRFQPRDTVLFAGGTAILEFMSRGPSPSIQWLHNGEPIPGETKPRLTIENVQPENSGSYRAVLTTATEGPVYSDPAALTLTTDFEERTLLIDVGSASYPSVGPDSWGNHWNNLMSPSSGSIVQPLVLTDGTTHPDQLALVVTRSFTGSNSGGMTTGTWAPVDALRDSLYVNQGGTGRVQLTGLNSAALYDLKLFASRKGQGNTRVTRFDVDGQAPRYLDAADNVDATVSFENVAAHFNGTLSITLSPMDVVDVPQDYAYLGYVEVLERKPIATPYAVWSDRNGLSGVDAEASNDPDGDGMENILEFVLGSDPLRFSRQPALGKFLVGEDRFLMLELARNPASDVELVGEVSGNLTDWDFGPLHTEVLEDSSEHYRFRDRVPMSEQAARFIRVRVLESSEESGAAEPWPTF